MSYVDLHLHTYYSDGTFSPEELIDQAAKAKLKAISITDHDTVEGIKPVMRAGLKEKIEVLPGIELTAEFNGSEIHILGYLIDCENKPLCEKLALLKKVRIERIYKITEKLSTCGIEIDPEKIFALSGEGTIGRLHVARALVNEGKVKSTYEAFDKYIGDKCPAYVLGFRLSPAEAVKIIKNAGGVPVLAHPYTIRDDALLYQLIDFGIMGLEAYYPEHSQSMTNFYLNLAKERNLLVTGGSDCHGKAKPEIRIGSMKIPYELVEKLKEAKGKL